MGYMHLGVEPDVITTAKALGVACPLEAWHARTPAMSSGLEITPPHMGATLACAAGLAVANEFQNNDL